VGLFQNSDPLALQLPDADLLLYENVGFEQAAVLAELIEETQWRCDEITLYGKTHQQPRLVAWHGDVGASYRYSGVRHEPQPWSDTLQRIRERVESVCGYQFNSVLLNYYRDQHDSMGLHADDEPELGHEPVIASLSLGEERTLYFKHKTRRDLKAFKLPLPSGSLLIMKGATQRNWKHGMRKLNRPCGPRLNLTFRTILVQALCGSTGKTKPQRCLR
jgi:alkylated DNA repair dioxygenase AlkB